ncbi:hypothetical protein J3Q64DRAFT_1694071 [Phycomyces blakesleeanus]|uniref:C2H2-type zinc finger transcription factor n=2 Tax=Phycomyces blakesleeanus TaxID=4837 RepID=A0A167QCC0_PHYB8|nr:hypothetical protein PHYBLDRAFT_162539 [Phycomyces blakesleeanus NRRL 1555(-)]OAD79469.1 hypothetical protein PHYBLDRAFT_162539 [Phycomyces blakesleeanus NRRL 1555(-)]|eukprot:XP_018297509.1 hypothetical protein PHYBLDRAFT_162539 [Phycomyces blakesleeanus NRRL 1555(-)]
MAPKYTTKKNVYLTKGNRKKAEKKYQCNLCQILTVYTSLVGFKKHLNKITLHKDSSTAVSVDLENNGKIESGFTELEIVIENHMDYYDSCSSDEEDQYENNPRLTEAKTSDADNKITDSAIHMETHMRVLESFSTSMNDYAAGVTVSKSSHQSIEDIFILPSDISPFKSKAEFILHVLFHGDEDLASERLIKKIMYAMEMLLEVHKSARKRIEFSKPDAVINFHLRAKNNVLVFKTSTAKSTNQKSEVHKFSINMPSEYIKNMMACSGKTLQLSALPDFTENQRLHLNQGDKWIESPLLQHPMLTIQGSDYWLCENYTNFAVSIPKYKINTNATIVERFKRRLSGSSLIKVIIFPINMYSDDTSGNDSKQYNVYYSFLIYFAVMTLEEQNKWENTLFVCTCNHVLNAVDMLRPLVDNLVTLQKGIQMYSDDLGKHVLVVAPLLLFMGDNPCQSQLAMHKKTASRRFCRKYLILSPCLDWKHVKGITCFSHVALYDWPQRSKTFLSAFASSDKQSNIYKSEQSLSYVKNGSKEFLRLKAFDPTKDIPIEILHTIPLGLIKYLPVLTAIQKDSLQHELSPYRSYKSYNQTFSNQLHHSGSFVGRDFKQLIQILSSVISKLFGRDSNLTFIITSFHAVSRLASLIYICGVHKGFDNNLLKIRSAVDKVARVFLVLNTFIVSNPKTFQQQDFSFKSKLHLLHHLTKDMFCFSSVLQYKTENSEQFSKFICEHLFKTNCQATSRDVAKKFVKQFICRHLCNRGSYIVEKHIGNNIRPVRLSVGDFVKQAPIDFSKFNLHFFGSRANSKNSDILISNLRDKLADVFQKDNRWFLGKISIETLRDGRGKLVRKMCIMQEYQMISSFNVNTVYSCNIVTDSYDNIKVIYYRTSYEFDKNEVIVAQDIDMHLTLISNSSRRLLNVAKFGMFCWILVNISNIN